MALYKNDIQLQGFLGKDAETKSTASGNQFTVFSLATKSGYKDKQSGEWVSHTEWHHIVAFGKAAEFAKSLTKGDYVEVTGEVRSSEYESEGKKLRSWEIRTNVVRKLDRPAASGSEPAPENDAA
jgi:single-strand DNA-binding protein